MPANSVSPLRKMRSLGTNTLSNTVRASTPPNSLLPTSSSLFSRLRVSQLCRPMIIKIPSLSMGTAKLTA